MAEEKYRRLACAVCAAPFTSFQPRAIYCSRTCNQRAYWSRVGRTAERALAKQAKAEWKAEAKRLSVERKRAKAADCAARAEKSRQAVIAIPCLVCGGAVGDLRKKFCSVVCLKQSPQQRASKSADRKAYKMRRRGVTFERFADEEILIRDGWACQICGIKTPQKLRGTYKPNAPEVDHIVALSKGGAHVRSNVQCACRQCNGLKRDGPPRGQIGLFSAPV